jgi:hypothetical protein
MINLSEKETSLRGIAVSKSASFVYGQSLHASQHEFCQVRLAWRLVEGVERRGDDH